MAFLLDTVTLSEFRKKDRADPFVLKWQSANSGLGYVSVVTMNEIRYGIRSIEHTDAKFAQRLKQWYREILEAKGLFAIVPVELPIAEVAADFRYTHQMGYDDSLIAATASVHGLTLATRNLSDFEATGIAFVNPWSPAGV